MKQTSPLLLLLAVVSFSCGSTLHKIFDRNKTPHEQYADKLENKKLDETPEGRMWLAASKQALQSPLTVDLPYRQNGYFPSDRPLSLGLKFHAKRGEELTFSIARKNGYPFPIYSDLFNANSIDGNPLISMDTASSQFSIEVEETTDYILRLQPELFRSGQYTLSISIGPSLGFPVAYAKANVESFWGDDRDAGKRRHEGVDIFAPKHSPAIAAADGYITGVKEGGLGGKTVFLRPQGKDYTLYYAHLDKQLVREGQFVKKGETVGLVGNTGNAKHTGSHLHFGVYTVAGAIDPFPFIDKTMHSAAEAPDKNMAVSLKLIKSRKLNDSLVKANTEFEPLAVTSKGYLAALPDGRVAELLFNEVKATKKKENTNVAAKRPKASSKL